MLVRTKRVADFMDEVADGEASARDPSDESPVLSSRDTLETALRLFDSHGDERIAVVDEDPDKIIGWARQIEALALFNPGAHRDQRRRAPLKVFRTPAAIPYVAIVFSRQTRFEPCHE